MRVGIIGGGAAGLTTAWLLDEHHDVTLFEKADRLGGHAHTIDIELDGRTIAVDAGFQFFAASTAYTTFNRLLDVLDVPRRAYPATLTVMHRGSRHPLVMPPLRRGRPVWSSLTPRRVIDLIRVRAFLSEVPTFLRGHDTTVTIAEYLEARRLPKRFVDDVLLPLLLAFWCVEPDEFLGFAAYNVLHYLGANIPKGLQPPEQSQIAGGLKVYIDALAGGLTRTELRMGSEVTAIERDGEGYTIEAADGTRRTVDRVVLATNARQAHGLIDAIPDLEEVRAQLRRFEYFDTTIAIHGDRRLMPRHESEWSVVNARWDGAHSALSIWNPHGGLPVFKSWVTFEERMPEPLYALATYEHGKITVDYFDAQRRLAERQGEHGLWLAGLYAHDADSHESAIRSAVTVVEGLAPESRRLRQLTQ